MYLISIFSINRSDWYFLNSSAYRKRKLKIKYENQVFLISTPKNPSVAHSFCSQSIKVLGLIINILVLRTKKIIKKVSLRFGSKGK